MKDSLGRKWKLAHGKNNFSVVFSKSTTNRCATINVNGHADHDYFLRFLEMSIHQLIGPLIWR